MTTTSQKEPTPQQRIALLRHLAGGKTLDTVAAILNLPREAVLDTASKHGYPDPKKMEWAADLLVDKQLDAQKAAAITPAPHLATAVAADSSRPVPTPSPVSSPRQHPDNGQALTKPDEIRVLLNTAKSHPSKRIQRAADRVFDDLDKLRTLIREDEEKNSARRKAEAERAARKAAEERKKQALKEEVARLEAELREKKAQLRSGKTKTAAATPAATTPAPAGGDHACDRDDCDRSFATVQALRMHQRRAHDGFNPNAARAAS